MSSSTFVRVRARGRRRYDRVRTAIQRRVGPHNPATYVEHNFKESSFDTGEILLNFAEAGSSDRRTPGRYTLENIGNDLVRFIALHIKRPVVVSGLSSGGLVAAWLSA